MAYRLHRKDVNQNVHVIPSLGGFRAVAQVSAEDGKWIAQGWHIQNGGYESVVVTALSIHGTDSNYTYTDTEDPTIFDEGVKWELKISLDPDAKAQPSQNFSLGEDKAQRGRLTTKITATTVADLKRPAMAYITREQHINGG